jgi:phosphatidylserine/phosphatidylglycerophosphate/cardiolipin synthase-like enzyme
MEGTLQQYAGRLHREYSGKREVIIYDYVDVHIRMLEHMYHKRVQGYASIGYKAKCEGEVQDSVGILFDNKNFLPAFSQDIGQTKGQIVIVSPYMRKARVKGIARLFSAAELNGAQITIVTRPARSYRPADQPIISELLDSLKELGCTVAEREGIHQKFAVIDHRIIWYGSLNILSFGGSEESMMRLESREIACELESILT